jgi:glycosyltransferase involved in cell wall biosynthesis
MKVVQVNFRFDDTLTDPDALLDRYTTLTGWSGALLDAGAACVSVVQRFSRAATVTRKGVHYTFYVDHAAAQRTVVASCPDIVHVNGLDSPAETWTLRRALPASARMVVQDHGSQVPVERGGRIERRIRRLLRGGALRSADALFFTAAEQAEPWRAAGLIAPRQRVYQVLEASTTLRPMDRTEARRSSGLHGSPAVLWVGRLNANKDPLTLLDGFERSLPHLPEATLTMIYGEDDLLEDVRRRVAASPPLAARVRLAGRVPHHRIAEYCSAADLFALASHREGSGYALLEACACGAVPVVTSIPTFRVITANGAIGALWNPGDPVACAHALAGAARQDMRLACTRVVEHFEQNLSWSAVGKQAVAAYQDILGACTPPRKPGAPTAHACAVGWKRARWGPRVDARDGS